MVEPNRPNLGPSPADEKVIRDQQLRTSEGHLGTQSEREKEEKRKALEEFNKLRRELNAQGVAKVESRPSKESIEKKRRRIGAKILEALAVIGIAGGALFGDGQLKNMIQGNREIDDQGTTPEKTQENLEIDDQNITTMTADPGAMYGESNPYEITIGSEHEKIPEAHVDGYDNPGMWLSGNKDRPFDFANGPELARMFRNNAKKEVIYTGINQIETQAAYLSCMPDELKIDALKGLDMKQTAKKLDELASDQSEEGKKLFAEANQAFIDAINNADVEEIVINGKKYSAYIGYVDENGKVYDRDQVAQMDGVKLTHENMEVIQSEVFYKGEKGFRFTFKDKDGNYILHENGDPWHMDTREKCGNQPQIDAPAKGVKIVEQDDSGSEGTGTENEGTGTENEGTGTENEGTGTENEGTGTEDEGTGSENEDTGYEGTGKEGTEAQGGDYVIVDDYVNPETVIPEVVVVQDDGNQGYVDDNHATPGSDTWAVSPETVSIPVAEDIGLNGEQTLTYTPEDVEKDSKANETQPTTGGQDTHTDAEETNQDNW